MQPTSIRIFSWTYLAAIGVALAATAINWSATTAFLRGTAGIGDAAPAALAATIAVSLLIPLLLWYFVARRPSVVAKWLVVALTAIGVVTVALAVSRGTMQPGLAGTLGIVGVVLRVIATVQLFRADAAAWFAQPVVPA